MSLARVVYTQSASGNKNFSVPFPYISRDHIAVRVNGAGVNFTWNSTNVVALNEAPPVGAVVEVRRSSSINDKLVVFTDGSTITETDLNLLATQTFFLSQEADDLAQESNALSIGATGTANVATATANQALDASATAVTTANTASSTANNATNTANTALATANTASANAAEALTAAGQAETAASGAQEAASGAQTAATNAVDEAAAATAKANTAFSTANTALATANEAKTAATSADMLANLASNQARVAAENSAAAEVAAAAAAGAASNAAGAAADAVATASDLEVVVNQVLADVQAIAGGDLSDFAKNSDNLSLLANKDTARANLGLGNVDNTSDAAKPISTATQAALDGKAPSGHGHSVADVTGLQTTLDGKAASSHTHAVADVSGLQGALDGKANIGADINFGRVVAGNPTGRDFNTSALEVCGGGPEYPARWPSIGFHMPGLFAGTLRQADGNWFEFVKQGEASYANLRVMELSASGNVTAFSDIRLKTDLTKIACALDKVCTLNGYTYTRKDTGERQTGVIAQEVQKVLPEAVVDTGENLAVAYGNMVGLLIEAIKELKSEVDQLKGN